MAKKRASLYFNNEVAGNGGTRYVKGTQPGKHSPISQENVHLTKSYKQFIPQLMCGTSTVIDPNSAQASQPWLYNTIPRFTQVNVIRDDKGNITTVFNILKENTITNGVYSVAVRNVEDQAPVTIVIASQWVEDKDKDKWRYYRNGDFVTADWVQIGEKWYYIGADQYMVTGPHIIDGKQYYFKKKEEDLENKNNYGQMIAHKWWRINNTWYYFHSDGSRLYSGWRLDAKGTDWYYCGADGKMVENKVILWSDGKLYYVGSSGAMVKSAKVTDTDTGKTYVADGNGVLSEIRNDKVEIAPWLFGYSGRPTATGGRVVTYSATDRQKLKNIPNVSIDWYSYENQSGPNVNTSPYLLGRTFNNTTYGEGELIDENGRYWVAFGPKVLIPNYPDSGKLEADEFGKLGLIGCRVDVVLHNPKATNAEEKYVYIECAWSGDIKAHTYNNGIYQTGHPYPNSDSAKKESYNVGYVDGSIVEFMGAEPSTNGIMSKYTVEKLIVY